MPKPQVFAGAQIGLPQHARTSATTTRDVHSSRSTEFGKRGCGKNRRTNRAFQANCEAAFCRVREQVRISSAVAAIPESKHPGWPAANQAGVGLPQGLEGSYNHGRGAVEPQRCGQIDMKAVAGA